MTAEEIIKKIKAMPKSEQAEVFAFVRNWEASEKKTGLELKEAPATASVNYMDRDTFSQAKDRVFQQHSELLQKLAK